MKTCQNCGAIYPATDEKCPSCNSDGTAPANTIEIPQHKSSYTPLIIGIILFIIGCFTVPIGIVFILLGLIIILINIIDKVCPQKMMLDNDPELERKKLILQRPAYSPNSQEYKDWEEKYANTFIDKTIYYTKRNDIIYQFNIDNMSFYRSHKHHDKCGDFYFISEEYHEKVINYLGIINLLLRNVSQKCSALRITLYNPDDLQFKKEHAFANNFCLFDHHPITSTGKVAKFPYSLLLMFGESDNSHHKVLFDKYGNFSRGEFVCWRNGICYLMTAAVYNKEFQITKIYINDNGKKRKIFDIEGTEQNTI